MPKEYIEREALKEDLKESYDRLRAIYYGLTYDEEKQLCERQLATFIEAILRVKEAPAADVAPVVRCKDCLYSTERYGHMECIHGVSYRNTWNKPDFFCSYGERKEGADNEP